MLGLLVIVHLYVYISSIDTKLLKAIESSEGPLYLGSGTILPLDLHHEYFISFINLLLQPLCFLLNLPLFHHDIILLPLFLIFIAKLLVEQFLVLASLDPTSNITLNLNDIL